MAKKERLQSDLDEELNLDLNSEEGIEDILEKIIVLNVDTIREAIIAKMAVDIDPDVIDELIKAYDIDISGDDVAVAANQVYNVYVKEFG